MYSNVLRFLNSEQINRLEETMFTLHFKQGETVFKQGAPMTHIIIVKTGLLKVTIEDVDNKNIVVRLLKNGEIAGGPGFHNDNMHHFTLSTLTESDVVFIDVNLFENFILENNIFALELISYLNKAHINLYNKLLVNQNKHMNGRIANTLLYLSDRIYENIEFESDLKRQDIADMSSMTKESAIRILKNFKDEKVIECEQNHFKIINRKKLEDILQNG